MREIKLTTKIAVYPIAECSEMEKKLIEAAKEATKKAYAPYSGFKVGAAVLLGNGEIIAGNNQENAAYPSGLCAERVTIFFANATYPDQRIEAIAVAAYHNGGFTDDVITPCGGCRQVLLETENRFNRAIKILLYGNESVYMFKSAKDLLPFSFGDKMLK